MLFLLGVRAAMAEEVAANHDGLQEGLDHESLAEFLGDDHGLDRARAKAAFSFCERGTEQAQFGELRPHFRAPAGVRLRDFAARVEVVLLGHQLGDRVAQHVLFGGEAEIHVVGLLATPSRHV
jgi:hypothetical protein